MDYTRFYLDRQPSESPPPPHAVIYRDDAPALTSTMLASISSTGECTFSDFLDVAMACLKADSSVTLHL